MHNYIDKYCYRNNELVQVSAELFSYIPEVAVYEIMRVIGGVPLFIEDHFIRLEHSLQAVSILSEAFTLKNFQNKIASLCEANHCYFGNVEILVSKTKDNKFICSVGFVRHNYPEPLKYLEGVSVAILDAERQKPNAKVKSSKTRLKADAFLKEHNYFEVLLSNSQDQITEGSRSNFFYLIADRLYTAPEVHVLAGITRKFIVKAAQNAGVRLHEALLSVPSIQQIDAAFLSGTSLGVLPIKKIKDVELNVQHPLLAKLMKAYNELVQEYCSNYKIN